ncbi:homeodomain-interacting protein kinase 4-like isoform X2 [Synchiropus splendidus]|nr:homeodomain-interacting protein kinase 4-like isoform X2 [Synchiropus splendidus]
MMGCMGEGSFGYVVQCKNLKTKEIVAVKISKDTSSPDDVKESGELITLQKLRRLDPDRACLIKYHDYHHVCGRVVIVFEKLDITIYDYMKKRGWAPMPICDLKNIMKDIATACKALKEVGVIHTDMKLDNVMLVDQRKRPLRTKLIDFGESVKTKQVCTGTIVQALPYRAPEVILGLRYTEAIDIWSLGMITAHLFIGFALCPGTNEYETMRCIIKLLGKPPKKMLDEGIYTRLYFYKCPGVNTSKKIWTFKTPEQYEKENRVKPKDRRKRILSSLDEIKSLPLHNKRSHSSEEISACVELMKKMLQIDPKNRISVYAVLLHPFLTDDLSLMSESEL